MSEDAYLEVWAPAGALLAPLTKDSTTIGRAPANDVVLEGDGTVSKLHAVVVPAHVDLAEDPVHQRGERYGLQVQRHVGNPFVEKFNLDRQLRGYKPGESGERERLITQRLLPDPPGTGA